MQTTTPAELEALLTEQRWTQFQVYGILPNRSIHLHLVGSISALQIDAEGAIVRIHQPAAFYAGDVNVWRKKSDNVYFLPGNLWELRGQPIGKHRLAVIFPGVETLTTVLFGEEDDGRIEEPFPGFTFGPIDLNSIVATPYVRRASRKSTPTSAL